MRWEKLYQKRHRFCWFAVVSLMMLDDGAAHIEIRFPAWFSSGYKCQ